MHEKWRGQTSLVDPTLKRGVSCLPELCASVVDIDRPAIRFDKSFPFFVFRGVLLNCRPRVKITPMHDDRDHTAVHYIFVITN